MNKPRKPLPPPFVSTDAPKEINPEIDYLIHTKDTKKTSDNIDLLNLLKSNYENLYLTTIPEKYIKCNLNEYKYNFNDFFNSDKYKTYKKQFFPFVKNLILVEEYIKNKKFYSYCCAHWNPRTKKIIIHPGSQRIKVLKLFNEIENTKFIFWNTNGVWFDWMDNDDIIELSLENDFFKKYEFGILLDHGSSIPQVHFIDKFEHLEWIENYYYSDILPQINKIKIFYEFECTWLKRFKTKFKETATIEIIVKNEKIESIYKCVFISFLGIDYEDDDIIVTQLK